MDLLYKSKLNLIKNGSDLSEDDLKDFLKKTSDLYYIGESPISDAEFDQLRCKFKESFGYDCIVIGTSKNLNKGFLKVKHDIPMGSLEEFSTKDDVEKEIIKWANKYSNKDEFCVSEKLDGLSVSVKYEKGILIQALTRGDGLEGDDITQNVLKMERVLKTLPVEFTGFLRGEIVLKKSVKNKYFPHYANERNGAVGLVKRIDGVGCEHLDIFFFKFEKSNFELDTEYDSLNFIKNNLTLITPRFYKVNLKTLVVLHKKYEEEAREKLDYLLDGLVVTLNCKKNQESITENFFLPEHSRKYKFTSEQAITELIMVKNQVGRTGAITPVAILEPVNCGGTTITKATLHNYFEIKRLGIKAGDYVKIVRSKDVIPKIVGVSHKGDYSEDILPPTQCPECNHDIKIEETIIYCPNEYCGAKVSKGLTHWLNVLNIKNISDKIVDSLIDAGKIKNIVDFYKLSIEDIASIDGQGPKNAQRILEEINNKRNITLAELLAGLNIRNLSIKRAEILENNFSNLDNILNLKISDIVNLEGFDEKLAIYIVSGIKSKNKIIKEILSHIKIKQKVTGILSGKSFCFSGFRDEKLNSKIKSKGGSISEGFSKKINYLVVRNKEVTTSKIQKAKQYGTNIIDLEELEKMLGNLLF
jgi:DNA ligase (NAD+)